MVYNFFWFRKIETNSDVATHRIILAFTIVLVMWVRKITSLFSTTLFRM